MQLKNSNAAWICKFQKSWKRKGSGFYRILRPRETPFVRHNKDTTTPVFTINLPISLKTDKRRLFLCFRQKLVDVFLFVCKESCAPASASLRKTTMSKVDFLGWCFSEEVTLRLMMNFGNSSELLLTLKNVHQKGQNRNLARVHRNKRAVLSFRSLTASLSLPLPDEWTPRLTSTDFYRQTFRICISSSAQSGSANEETSRQCRLWKRLANQRSVRSSVGRV